MIYRILIFILRKLQGVTREQFDMALALVNSAEQAMSGKSGAEKRAYVLDALKDALYGMKGSTLNWLIETALAYLRRK